MADSTPTPQTQALQDQLAAEVDNNLNTQLKAIQARIDRIDDDFIANYAGISELVAGLAANPITAGSVAKSLKTYNFSATGQKLQKALLGLIPGVDTFRSLQNLDTAGMLDKLGSRLEAQADQMAQTVQEQVSAAVEEQVKALEQQATAIANQATATVEKVNAIARDTDAVLNKVSAEQSLQAAVEGGASAAEIAALTEEKDKATEIADVTSKKLASSIDAEKLAGALVLSATSILNEKVAGLEDVTKAAAAVAGFLLTLNEIAKGKTSSSVIQNTGSVDTSTTTATVTSSNDETFNATNIEGLRKLAWETDAQFEARKQATLQALNTNQTVRVVTTSSI